MKDTTFNHILYVEKIRGMIKKFLENQGDFQDCLNTYETLEVSSMVSNYWSLELQKMKDAENGIKAEACLMSLLFIREGLDDKESLGKALQEFLRMELMHVNSIHKKEKWHSNTPFLLKASEKKALVSALTEEQKAFVFEKDISESFFMSIPEKERFLEDYDLYTLCKQIYYRNKAKVGSVEPEDAVQQALFKVWVALLYDKVKVNPNHDPKGIRAYFGKVMFNSMLESSRPECRKNLNTFSMDSGSNSDDATAWNDDYIPDPRNEDPFKLCVIKDIVTRVTDKMNEKQQIVFHEVLLNGVPQKELAERLGCEQASISQTVKRVKQIIASVLTS